MTNTELDALKHRIRELRTTRATLASDQDDPRILSNLVVVQQQLEKAEHELGVYWRETAA